MQGIYRVFNDINSQVWDQVRQQGPITCRQWVAEDCDWSVVRVSGGTVGRLAGPDWGHRAQYCETVARVRTYDTR